MKKLVRSCTVSPDPMEIETHYKHRCEYHRCVESVTLSCMLPKELAITRGLARRTTFIPTEAYFWGGLFRTYTLWGGYARECSKGSQGGKCLSA